MENNFKSNDEIITSENINPNTIIQNNVTVSRDEISSAYNDQNKSIGNEQKELKDVLNSVIDLRGKNAVDFYKPIEESLLKAIQCCHSIRDFEEKALWKKMMDETQLSEQWSSLQVTAEVLRKKISLFGIGYDYDVDISGDFRVAMKRAERPYINIGIVAAFRQGKSTMLRQLVGVDPNNGIGYTDEDKEYLIPTSSDETKPCTGTKIHYINDVVEGKDNQAVIVYYTKGEVLNSMLELLLKTDKVLYKRCCDLGSIEKLRDSLRDSLYKDCTGKESQDLTSGRMGQTGSPKEALWRYVYAPESAFEKLGSEPEVLDISNLKNKQVFYKSVCFYRDPKHQTDDTRSYEVLSVKEASVYKRFTIQGKDPGKIRFMDTPGVGEARTSVEKTLTDALRNEIDVAIAICKIDNVQIEYINQFNDYIKRDFNIVCVIDEKQYDIKDCLYYVLNVSGNTQRDKIFEHKNASIRQSLAAPIKEGGHTIVGISIKDDHIVAIDCKKNVKYGMTDGEGVIEGHNKKVTNLTDDEENGCGLFLYNVLSNLKNTIGIIDNYFNHKAIQESGLLLTEYEKLKESISELGLPDFEYSQERINLKNKIKDSIKINPEYQDSSDDKLKEFNGKGKHTIVLEFLKSAYPNVTNDTYVNVILSETDYKALLEMDVYWRLKKGFMEYYKGKLKECFDIGSIESSVKKCTKDIAQVLIDVGFGEVVTNNADVWFDAFNNKYGKNYPELKRLFGEIINVNAATTKISDYVTTDLQECFHMELGHKGKDECLFKTKEDTAKMFMEWLEDIADSLIKITDQKSVPGIRSFKTVVDESKQSYLNHYTDLRWGLSNEKGKAYGEWEHFIDANAKTLFKDVVKKQELAKQWKDFVIAL